MSHFLDGKDETSNVQRTPNTEQQMKPFSSMRETCFKATDLVMPYLEYLEFQFWSPQYNRDMDIMR